MLKVRVIPTLLWKGPGLVKGISFDSWRRVGPVLPALKVYNLREVDELVIVDIEAHRKYETEDLDYESIMDFSHECFVPLTVGGGIHRLEQVRYLLRAGADKVCVNTAAYIRPNLLADIADKFGSQCVVSSIDVRGDSTSGWECHSHAGTRPTNWKVTDWAREVEAQGAGEILLTSIIRDGTMTGYDIDLIKAVTNAVGIPVIASGGAGTYGHMVDAVIHGGASAVAAASMFHFTEQTPLGAKSALESFGVPVRSNFTG